MVNHVIRANSLTGSDLIIEADSPGDAAERFGRTIGLMVTDFRHKTDGSGMSYVEFRIGTGASFVAYAEQAALDAGAA